MQDGNTRKKKQKRYPQCKNVIITSLLLTCMSSIVQPMGLPFDRGPNLKAPQRNLHVTAQSPEWVLSRYANPQHASSIRFLSDTDICKLQTIYDIHNPTTSRVKSESQNKLLADASYGYMSFHRLGASDYTDIRQLLLTSCADLVTWSNYYHDNKQNFIPQTLLHRKESVSINVDLIVPPPTHNEKFLRHKGM